MMRINRIHNLVTALVLLLSMTSCVVDITPDAVTRVPLQGDSEISVVCAFDARTSLESTKSLIDQVTTKQLNANFLKIDESVGPGDAGTYKFGCDTRGNVNWDNATLCEATVISSPDNTEDIYYRSMILSPSQVYSKKSTGPEERNITDFYHTRMVGWYPQNCVLDRNSENKVVQKQFSGFSAQRTEKMLNEKTYKAVRFTGLDGATDLMVSNVCEGQYLHSTDPAISPSTNKDSNLPYRKPFGHYQSYSDGDFTTRYSNYFKFRHYLSGIRIWGFVPEQNTHALDMWGNITDVVLLNQPTSVSVTLPEQPRYYDNGDSLPWESETDFANPDYWGQAVDWGAARNLSVQTGPMFGDDSNHMGDNYTVDFSNVDMRGVGDIDDALYLGYSLIRPDAPVTIEIHTRYGVYVTTVQNSYVYDEGSDPVNIFEAGYYYDVYLSLETNGTISAIIETRSDGQYYDLTRSVTVSDTGIAQEQVVDFRYANSYIVDPENDLYDKNEDGVCDYSGFFFSAMIAGNGESGISRYNSLEFYPSSAELKGIIKARLVWESSQSLVTEVELINGYIKFKVPGITDPDKYTGDGISRKYNGTRGNAVIGVFDKNDVCLWSWHIWITDSPEELTFTTSLGKEVTLMDRNLGATFGGTPADADQALASYGLYYQWGRKDPSMGPPVYNYSRQDCTTAVFYDYASDPVDSAMPMSFEYPELSDGVKNPMYLILPTRLSQKGYAFDWLNYGPANYLWGWASGREVSKTIYDPCPFGYKVPSTELTDLMSSIGYNSEKTYGLTFTQESTSVFFPYAGYKGVDKGMSNLTTAWNYVGKKGDYQEALYSLTAINTGGLYYRKRILISSETTWSEDRALGKHPYYYGGGSTDPSHLAPVSDTNANVFSDYANRRTATSVRCVRDPSFTISN